MSGDVAIFFGQAAGVRWIPFMSTGGVVFGATGGTRLLPSGMVVAAIGTIDV
jgi:hypothetical protein